VFLDSTVVSVALPEIGRDLPSTTLEVLEGQSYVYYGYLLSLSALLILAGGLADFYGRRKLFGIGMAGFGITSVICGLAPTLDLLVLARVLQGAAGAILVPGSLAIISASFSGEEEGRAFGIWAGASAATTIFGPALGGFLVTSISWRAVFLINVPLVVFGLWATLKHVPESRDESAHGRFHWAGAVAVAIAVGGLTFGAIRGEATDWESAVAFLSLALGAVALVAVPIMMLRASNPLIPPKLFRSRNFTVTNISTLVIYGAIYVTFQFMALYVIGTLGYNELGYGIATIPSSVFLVLFSTKFGTLAARYGPRLFMAVGPAIMGLGLLWFARIPSDSAAWLPELGDPGSLVPPSEYLIDVLPGLVVFGIGLMVMVAPLTTALMRSVPVENSGVASAVNNAISRVGPQLAGALLFIAISASFVAALQDAPVTERGSSNIDVNEISPLNAPPPEAGEELSAAIEDASTSSFSLAMLVGAGLCFAGAAVNAVGIRNEHLREEPSDETVGDQTAAAAPTS
jgi:EmrB/QacA subfamily drug resistance transporter